ncbi:FAD-dependent monooxygenase [Pseudokineococcus basanitobsidens]|uniref:FAD-dependent monooxygenase n=1 Tax=Pseudokineococcus basanitobsidens TaxID=1926649 RepID=A0ABU8RKS2_9ACTN
MRVAVVGAGVGGLAVDRALRADGHEVVVLEEAPTVRASGGAVTLWPGSTSVLRGLGVDAAPLGRVLTRMQRRSPDGRVLLELDLAAAARAAGSAVVTAPRGRLVDALLAGVPGGGGLVRTGCACAGVADGPQGAAVVLADGSRVVADVVVGADGARSAVRAALHADALLPTGGTTWQLPPSPTGTALDDGGTCVLLVGRSGMVGLNPCGDGRVQVWWDVRSAPRPGEAPAAMLERLFGSWPVPESRAALSLLGRAAAQLVPYPRGAYRVHRPWGRGRVTLLGDAAHAVPPSLAQGTNQALADAAALARALRTPGARRDPASALRAYERAAGRRAALVTGLSRREPTLRVVPEPLLRGVPDRAVAAVLDRWLRLSSDRAAA